jgi:CRISPR/Cas system-associated exonuclease Cas4 (RecB family)
MARNSLKSVCRLIDVANAKLPPEQSFLSDLKRSIELADEKNRRKPSQTYKPSAMNCIRGMYYQLIGAEQDPAQSSYCSVGICNSGSDIHIRVQQAVEAMKTSGIDCEYIDVADFVKTRNLDYLTVVSKSGMETKLYYESLNMSFLSDGIVRYKNHYYVLEIKTETSFKWTARTDVDPGHKKQGTAYSIAFQLPEIIFLYVNRDILDMKAYLFVPSDEEKENLIGQIEECNGYVKRMICPPKPENISKKTCTYCAYAHRCAMEV